MAEVRRKFQDRVTSEILLGGLRPGNKERFDEQRRSYILGHWQEVHKRTGQPFDFSFQMGPEFTYDTEPAARAVVAIRSLASDQEVNFLEQVQQTFYVKNADVTKEPVLADVAQSCGINREDFLQAFRSPEIQKQVLTEFDRSRSLKVQGFPTLLGELEGGFRVLTHGYQPFASLSPIIETWLNDVMDRA